MSDITTVIEALEAVETKDCTDDYRLSQYRNALKPLLAVARAAAEYRAAWEVWRNGPADFHTSRHNHEIAQAATSRLDTALTALAAVGMEINRD